MIPAVLVAGCLAACAGLCWAEARGRKALAEAMAVLALTFVTLVPVLAVLGYWP